jgi:hypothetical protein
MHVLCMYICSPKQSALATHASRVKIMHSNITHMLLWAVATTHTLILAPPHQLLYARRPPIAKCSMRRQTRARRPDGRRHNVTHVI